MMLLSVTQLTLAASASSGGARGEISVGLLTPRTYTFIGVDTQNVF
jgi:hypothetical protein